METKEYPISDDIVLFSYKFLAADAIRDLAVKLPFGYRKAFKAAADSIRFRKLFWDRIQDVYPELKGKRLTFIREKNVVVVNDGQYDET